MKKYRALLLVAVLLGIAASSRGADDLSCRDLQIIWVVLKDLQQQHPEFYPRLTLLMKYSLLVRELDPAGKITYRLARSRPVDFLALPVYQAGNGRWVENRSLLEQLLATFSKVDRVRLTFLDNRYFRDFALEVLADLPAAQVTDLGAYFDLLAENARATSPELVPSFEALKRLLLQGAMDPLCPLAHAFKERNALPVLGRWLAFLEYRVPSWVVRASLPGAIFSLEHGFFEQFVAICL